MILLTIYKSWVSLALEISALCIWQKPGADSYEKKKAKTRSEAYGRRGLIGWPKNRRNVELHKKVHCSPSAPPQTSALTEPMLTPELTLHTSPWVSSHTKPSEPLVASGRDQISYVYPSRQALSTLLPPLVETSSNHLRSVAALNRRGQEKSIEDLLSVLVLHWLHLSS